MPVLQVERPLLGLLENLKLLATSFFAELLGFQIFSPEDGIDILQPGSLEAKTNVDPEQLVRIRVYEMIERRGGSNRWYSSLAAKGL